MPIHVQESFPTSSEPVTKLYTTLEYHLETDIPIAMGRRKPIAVHGRVIAYVRATRPETISRPVHKLELIFFTRTHYARHTAFRHTRIFRAHTQPRIAFDGRRRQRAVCRRSSPGWLCERYDDGTIFTRESPPPRRREVSVAAIA